jgi:pyruvate,water dikinase
MLTQGVYDRLGRACAAAGLEGHEIELVGGLDGVEEAAVVDDLWAHSRGRLDRATVLARHGFHGPEEGELSATVWRERPTLLDGVVSAFAAMADGDEPRAKRARSRAAALAAGRGLGPRARPLIALVRNLMPLRETGRGGLVRALDGTRCAARRLGDRLVTDGALEDRDDVFFLTLDELAAPPPDARELVGERRARHDRYLALTLPDGWLGDPAPLIAQPDRGEDVVTGAAASPGVVTGVARVVGAPDQRDELQAGEILVCHTTDPGWASLMQLAGGLVIDVGGPLSHGAIVARELDVPCVIGTRSGSTAIRTGDRVEVDGTTGTVRILERSIATP